MPIDAHDRRRGVGRRGPCGAGGSGAAAEVDQHRRTAAGVRKRQNDVPHEQVMERTVEEGERGALARAGQRGTHGSFAAALDVSG